MQCNAAFPAASGQAGPRLHSSLAVNCIVPPVAHCMRQLNFPRNYANPRHRLGRERSRTENKHVAALYPEGMHNQIAALLAKDANMRPTR